MTGRAQGPGESVKASGCHALSEPAMCRGDVQGRRAEVAGRGGVQGVLASVGIRIELYRIQR